MRPSISMALALAAMLLVFAGAGGPQWLQVGAGRHDTPALTVSADGAVVTPRVVLAALQTPVVVRNRTARPLLLTSTPHAPASFQRSIAAGASAQLRFTRSGLYHLYDAATARVGAYQADSDVVRARPGTAHSDAPMQVWIIVPDRRGILLDAHVDVPAGNDLLDPPVTAVRVGGTVTLHNDDTDAHNIVTDPADPTGAAFEIFGTDDEPSIHGAERRITFTVPGLYHIYCSMHTRVMGHAGPWNVVVPRDRKASGYAQHNPMEAWVLVVPDGTP